MSTLCQIFLARILEHLAPIMASLENFRVVYKVVDSQEIDADVYLPGTEHMKSFRAPICTCIQLDTKCWN